MTRRRRRRRRSGLATHFCPAAQLPALEAALAALPAEAAADSAAVGAAIAAAAAGARPDEGAATLSPHEDEILRCFGAPRCAGLLIPGY
jgi:hypothetical protein